MDRREKTMIELCFAVSNKETGEEVHRNYGKFESMEDFYLYMDFKYGYTSRNYHFLLSGREIKTIKNKG